jgi:miniconductance mechanosensitive channel
MDKFNQLAFFQERDWLLPVLLLATLFLISWVCFFFIRAYLIRFIEKITSRASRASRPWASIFFDQNLLAQVSWILPIIFVHAGSARIEGLPAMVTTLVHRLSLVMLIVISLRALLFFTRKINLVYSGFAISKSRPIKGILQVFLIVAYFIGGVSIIAILMDRSPMIFLSGLGAMTAILLLVFRDTILSLVAGVQLTSNNLICVGDWVEMPQFNADGDVIDIALNTVKIQNWDQTITVIPTHKFLEHSFKNWRGMSDSGGRRIMRSVHIDLQTVQFLTEEQINHFQKFHLLKDYILEKKNALQAHNESIGASRELIANSRRLTNIGTFRAYLTQYLRQHPRIHQKMTFLVRQLEATPTGLPIQVYVFTNDIAWANYESIQGDIFDHILAIAPEFGLRVYQNPSGYDVQALKQAYSTQESAQTNTQQNKMPVSADY